VDVPYFISPGVAVGLMQGDTMGMYSSDISITADKKEVLARLKTNLAAHKKIVTEAKAGYLERAKKEISRRLDDLASGKIVNLQFGLALPQDNSRAYTSAIAALEMHTGDTIQLSGVDVRTLILNQWDWMQTFLGTNAMYSGTAREIQSSDADPEEEA
jgi:hypothetical protein